MSTQVVQVQSSAIANTEPTGRTLMTEPDELAIKLVVLDGHRMKLKGEERTEAIRLMTERKVPSKIMAWRLCIHYETLRRAASRANITLPDKVKEAHWTYNYVEKGASQEKIDEYNARRRDEARQRRSRDRGNKGPDNVA